MNEAAFLADVYYNTMLRRYVRPDTSIVSIVDANRVLGLLNLTVLVTPRGKDTVELKHTLNLYSWAGIPNELVAQLMMVG